MKFKWENIRIFVNLKVISKNKCYRYYFFHDIREFCSWKLSKFFVFFSLLQRLVRKNKTSKWVMFCFITSLWYFLFDLDRFPICFWICFVGVESHALKKHVQSIGVEYFLRVSWEYIYNILTSRFDWSTGSTSSIDLAMNQYEYEWNIGRKDSIFESSPFLSCVDIQGLMLARNLTNKIEVQLNLIFILTKNIDF